MSELKTIDVDEIKQRAKLAHKYICELAAREHRWTMCVPPQKDDSDMALQAPLDDIEHLIEEIEKLNAEKQKVAKILHELRLIQIYINTKEKYIDGSLIAVENTISQIIKKFGDV